MDIHGNYLCVLRTGKVDEQKVKIIQLSTKKMIKSLAVVWFIGQPFSPSLIIKKV
jgi:hypothetical protein